ncbi:MAG: BLUF domain-containing protein [Methylophaga sp.]|nr:BLUF domain-containing protein [Methylophaga sp.]
MLEGKKISVEYIYNTVKIDSRHNNLIELCAEAIDSRMFPHWEMGFQHLTKQQIAEISNAHQLFGNEMTSNDIDRLCRRARAFFEAFVRSVDVAHDYNQLRDVMLRV